MIVEIEKHGKGKIALAVADIISVEIGASIKPDNGFTYELIIATPYNTHRLWFNKEEAKANAAYEKVKEAIKQYRQKDEIAGEIKRYLDSLKG